MKERGRSERVCVVSSGGGGVCRLRVPRERCSVNEGPCVVGGEAPGQGLAVVSPAPLRRKNSALGESVAGGCWGAW